MNLLQDRNFKLKYQKCKYKVKLWEGDFKKKNGHNPTKIDIKEAPAEVRSAYKLYYQMKTKMLEELDILIGEEETVCTAKPIESEADTNTIENVNDKGDGLDKAEMHRVALADILNCNDSTEGNLMGKKNVPKEEAVEKNTEPENNVWGSHLNKPKVPAQKKSVLPRSLSSTFAEKLSKRAQFSKRNPRKSLSSRSLSGSKSSIYNTLSQDSISEPFSSSSIDFSQDKSIVETDSVTSIAVQSNDSQREHTGSTLSSFISEFQTLKCVSEKRSTNNQPVNFIQKAVSSIKTDVPLRNINKEWLERCTVVNTTDDKLSCLNDNAVDEPWEEATLNVSSLENSSNLSFLKNSICDDIDSDEEIVYSSDDESLSLFSLKRKSSVSIHSAAIDGMNMNKKHKVDDECKNESQSIALSNLFSVNSSQQLSQKLNTTVEIEENSVIGVKDAGSSITHTPCEELTQKHIEDLASQIVENKAAVKTKNKVRGQKLSKQELLEKKLATGQANDNFQRINLKKKVYVRGKKTMTYAKHKKLQWKANKRSASLADDVGYSSDIRKCFKCGDVGHFARNCLNENAGDKLMPQNEEEEEDESPFPSLEEAAAMALSCKVSAPLSFKPPTQDELSFNPESETFTGVKIPEDVRKALLQSDEKKLVQPVYDLLPDGQPRPPTEEVYSVLREFGHSEFRTGQAEAIMRILSGLSTLVTLSTGSGKSLCYQLPALMYSRKSSCLTLVVSPLVSLMEDQVNGLAKCLRIACLHHNQPEKLRKEIMEKAKAGELDALLVSPEAVMSGERSQGFGRIMRELPPIAFACIDEAHCLSQWSYNFRPSYLMISEVLRKKLGVKTFLGLTATATLSTCTSIIHHLDIPDDGKAVIKDIPLPQNLVLTVSCDRKRDEALLGLLAGPRFAKCDSIIIYCIRRNECERLAVFIRTCLQVGKRPEENKVRCRVSTNAEPYHAGLSAARRRLVQKNFMTGKLRIVIATVAFGMGIDKKDIRAVIHYNMPRNFESYVQEVGRAGRDGLPAQCHLFLDPEAGDLSELRRYIFGNSVDRHVIRKLLQRVFIPCRCNKLKKLAESTYIDGKEVNNLGASSPVKCPGHEVAFKISETVQALDLPEENISTLLCYLELHPKQWIKVLPPVYTMCKVLSYRGPRALKVAAQQSAPLAMAIALEQHQGISHEKCNNVDFPVIDVAAALNWDSSVVKRHLKNLEWNNVGGKWRRTRICVELHELGFRVHAPGMLSPDELDEALDALHERVESQERSCLLQLQSAFDAFSSVAFSTYKDCCDEVDETCSENLKKQIRVYFQQESMFAELKLQENLFCEEQVISDIRQLVCSYPDTTFTGRSVARIFHGIESPCFPAQIWGRCRFWRAHLKEDFKLLMRIASREILTLR